MEKILIFLSTERNNTFFNNELGQAVNFLKAKSASHTSGLQHVRLVSVVVSGSEAEDSSNDGVTHTSWLDWKDDEEALANAIVHNQEENENENEEQDKFRYNDFFLMAEALHKIADSNQELGSFLIQVIWCVDSYTPNPSEVPEFYGALKRFRLWHSGGLYLVCKDDEVTNEWPPFLPLQCTKSSDQIVSDTVDSMWRGNLMVSEDNGDTQIFSECVINCISGQPVLMADSKQDPLFMLPHAEVVCDFDTGTLPWMYVKQGSVYSLTPTPCSDPEDQEEASELLQLLTQRSGSGTLIRLRYSPLPPTMEGIKSLTTVEWKKSYADGNFDISPSLSFKGHHLIQNMVLLSEGATPGKGLLVALQDPSVCGEDVFKLIKKNASSICEHSEKRVLSLLKETPCLSSLHMAALSHLALNLPKQIKKRVESRGADKELDPEMKAQLEAESSKQLLQSLQQMPAPPYKLPTHMRTILPETCVSSSMQWAEYIALVEAEQEAERQLNKHRNAADFLGGLAPPPPPENILPLEAAFISQLFIKKTGEPTEKIRKKMSSKLPSAKQFNLRGRATLEEIKAADWADILYSRQHGLYFNVDENTEDLEETCIQLQAQVIRRETASTCTVFQDKEVAYVTVNTNTSQNKNKPDQPKGKTKVNEKSRKSLPAKLTTTASEADTASVNSGQNNSRQLTARRKSPRKSQIEPEKARRSPRKSGRRDSDDLMKPSSLLQPAPGAKETRPGGTGKTSAAVKNPGPANLSDSHKAKLRIAIVEALGSEGMNMKDPMFKVCFKKLFAVSLPFVKDTIRFTKGSTSKALEKITKSHVKQVIEFENLKNNR